MIENNSLVYLLPPPVIQASRLQLFYKIAKNPVFQGGALDLENIIKLYANACLNVYQRDYNINGNFNQTKTPDPDKIIFLIHP